MLIAIVGNIGTGKTTLVRTLSNFFPEVRFIEECRSDFLDEIYQNQEFFFQNQVHYYLQCLDACLDAAAGSFVIQDRCVMDMHGVFSNRLYQSGLLGDKELSLLESLKVRINKISRVDCYIYIYGDAEVLLKRIRLRAVREEKGIDLEMIQDVGVRYKEWYSQEKTVKDLIINSNNLDTSAAFEIASTWLKNQLVLHKQSREIGCDIAVNNLVGADQQS